MLKAISPPSLSELSPLHCPLWQAKLGPSHDHADGGVVNSEEVAHGHSRGEYLLTGFQQCLRG